MVPYEIKLVKVDSFWRSIFGWMFNRKFKNVKGHYFPKDLPPYIMMVTLTDERRYLFDMRKFQLMELSKEFYLNIASDVQNQTNGQVRMIETQNKEIVK